MSWIPMVHLWHKLKAQNTKRKTTLLRISSLASLLVLATLGITLFTVDKPVRAESNPLGIQGFTHQSYYAYVQAGETLDISFVKTTNSPNATSRLTVTGPGNIIHSADGVGTPNQPCQFNVTGTTCSWTGLSAPTSGLWEIKFNTNPEQGVGFTSDGGQYTWNINVKDSLNAVKSGRVYSQLISLRQNVGQSHNIQAWYQSRDGYLYNVTQRGYGGVNSTLIGDNVGVRQNSTCLSGYRNLPATGYSTPALFECGEPFKIFVGNPDPTLPAQAPLPNGTMEWLKPAPTPPTVTGTTFTGNSLSKRSGNIGYTLSSFTGQYLVEVDTNGDGVYNGPLDRSFPQFSSGGGPTTIPFDGNYANGSPIPVTQDINVRVGIYKGGEIHFTGADIEIRTGGIEVQVLNGNTPGAYLNVGMTAFLQALLPHVRPQAAVISVSMASRAKAGCISGAIASRRLTVSVNGETTKLSMTGLTYP